MINERFNSWINNELVKEALLKFENKKSLGPDGLKPIIFQHLPDNIISEITFIYKSCIDLGFTPSKWREANVIFIPKPGKTDYSVTNAFRPISLSNYLLKGLERLCVWRVDQALLEFPIHENQHGFRCDRSTETAISEVTDEIEKHIYKRKRTLGVFLDIKSAFDSISPKQIRRCLLNHRTPETLVEWYYNYITERNVLVELQGAKIRARVGIGFPQGGVASAKFWLVAFNMAVKIINSMGCKGTAFADDCAVLVSGTDPNSLVKTMQKTLVSLENWGRKCGLIFNPTKTVVIMFGRRKEWEYDRLKMGGVEIPFSHETKYLGVTLDSKLSWKPHINKKIDSAKKLIYLVNKAIRGNWGPAPDLTGWALTGIVRPSLCYASSVWAHALKGKGMMKRLDRIDRLGLLSIAQCAPSTPTQALRIIYGIPPTRVMIDKFAIDTLLRYRYRMTLDWDGLTGGKKRHKSHLAYLWDHVREMGVARTEIDDVRVVAPARKFRVVTDSFGGGKKFLARSQFSIYTDGSKISEGVGAGFAVYKAGEEILHGECRLFGGCTVFQAEVFAIFEAIRRLLCSKYITEVKYVKLFSDSSAALYALRKRKVHAEVVLNTMKILNRLAERGVTVSLVWIKAHVGHEGNERADCLAKEGASLDELESVWVKRPYGYLKRKSEERMLSCWNREWMSNKAARMSRQFFPHIDLGRSKEIQD